MFKKENISRPEVSDKTIKSSIFSKITEKFTGMMVEYEKEEYHCLIALKTGTRILVKYPTKEEALEYLDWYQSETDQPYKLIESLPFQSTQFAKENNKNHMPDNEIRVVESTYQTTRISRDDIESIKIKAYEKYEQFLIYLKVYFLQPAQGPGLKAYGLIAALLWSLIAAGFYVYTPIRGNDLIVAATHPTILVIGLYLPFFLISILYDAAKNNIASGKTARAIANKLQYKLTGDQFFLLTCFVNGRVEFRGAMQL